MVEHKCPECGKTFVPASEHVYVEDGKPFCKWSCLCAYRKKHGKNKAYTHKNGRKYTKQQKVDAVRLIVEEGKTITDVSMKLGISYTTLFGWVHRYKEWMELEQQEG